MAVDQTDVTSTAPRRRVPDPQLPARMLSEFVGSALLLIAVIGSGIQAQSLSPTDTGLALLENAFATAVALVAIILALGPVSGAHLNPVVTLCDAAMGTTTLRSVLPYVVAQIGGGIGGAVVANLMFSQPAVTISTKERSSPGLWLAEVVATFGLVLVIYGVMRSGQPRVVAFAVGAYIGGAYWFTSSTSFANPAVTLSRMFSNTFAGISPASVIPFVFAQIVGAALALGALRVLHGRGAPLRP